MRLRAGVHAKGTQKTDMSMYQPTLETYKFKCNVWLRARRATS